MIEGPVLVTVVPANTAKGVAVPNPTEDVACAYAAGVSATTLKNTMLAVVPTASTAANQWLVPPARPKLITNVTNCPHQSTNVSGRPAHSQINGWIVPKTDLCPYWTATTASLCSDADLE